MTFLDALNWQADGWLNRCIYDCIAWADDPPAECYALPEYGT